MNKELTSLLTGYQDLMDRYGAQDPLVIGMKAEVDRKREAGLAAQLPERRLAGAPSGAWRRADRHKTTRPADPKYRQA